MNVYIVVFLSSLGSLIYLSVHIYNAQNFHTLFSYYTTFWLINYIGCRNHNPKEHTVTFLVALFHFNSTALILFIFSLSISSSCWVLCKMGQFRLNRVESSLLILFKSTNSNLQIKLESGLIGVQLEFIWVNLVLV